jgi:hypothetical protein
MAIWRELSGTSGGKESGIFGHVRHAPLDRARNRPMTHHPPSIAMDAVSPSNVNFGSQSALGPTPQPVSRKVISQDEASALALLAQLPQPALATTGMLGTRLDAWA